MTRVLLVRHGESTWNAQRRWQGQADPPLTPRGERQSRNGVRAAVQHGPFDLLVTSALQRARRTGEILAAGLGIELGPAIPALSERDAGDWEGLTRQEIEAAYPGYLAQDRRPPGYETDETIVDRARDALAGLHASHPDRRLLVVSHGGVIHALERVHADDGWQRLDNLAGRWFDVDHVSVAPLGERVALVSDGGPPAPPPERGYA